MNTLKQGDSQTQMWIVCKFSYFLTLQPKQLLSYTTTYLADTL